MPATLRIEPQRPAEPARKPGTIVATRYRLESVIGRGGMGEVWAARDLRSYRRVAIKLAAFSANVGDGARARFQREAALAARLTGPAFAEVLDHGDTGSEAYMVMELLLGETLEARLDRVGKLGIEATYNLIAAVGAALEIAHAKRIIHRDLKPGNIFFSKPVSNQSGVFSLTEGAEVVKVLDFGIAKDSDALAALTSPDVVLGSAHYMSPEQVRAAKDVDARADVWSLAVIAYRALTGELPFGGEGLDTLVRVVTEAPAAVTTLDDTLPQAFDTFFRRALEKDPAARYPSIKMLLAAYRSIMDNPEAPLFEPTRETIRIPGQRDSRPETGRPTVVTMIEPAPSPEPVVPAPAAPLARPGFGRGVELGVFVVATLLSAIVYALVR